jgi:hypothetical protein
MDALGVLAVIFAIGVALVLLRFAVRLAFTLLGCATKGALLLLAFAAEQGFIGLAAYFACWVFMLPLMLVLSVVVGALASRGENSPAPATRPVSREIEEARWQEEDRLYEMQQRRLAEKSRVAGEG